MNQIEFLLAVAFLVLAQNTAVFAQTGAENKQLVSSFAVLPGPLPTPAKAATAKAPVSTHPGLSNCRFVLAAPHCNTFFGMSKPAIVAIFGEPEGYGDYSKLGLFFYFNADKVDEITFYGVRNEDHEAFYGSPTSQLNWNSSVQDAIRIYGEPTKRWENDDKTESSLSYDDSLRLHFQKNRLTSIVLRDPKADARYLARRAAADAKEASEREQQAVRVREQIAISRSNEASRSVMAEYESMHSRVEGNIQRAEKIAIEARKLQLQGMGNLARQKLGGASKLLSEARDLIDKFLKKHEGTVPASTRQHLLEDRAKLDVNVFQ